MFKKLIFNLIYLKDDLTSSHRVKLDWGASRNNLGDVLSPVIFNFISGIYPKRVSSQYYKKEHVLAIGSILERVNSNSIVWGSGFICKETVIKDFPKEVRAVRGKLTKKKLDVIGVKCPEVYGDPALLLPQFYKPETNKKYRVGLMPHYADKDNQIIKTFMDRFGWRFIDIQNSNPLAVIDQMSECETIITSSLHGLILSDAYKIPNVWVRFSDKIEGGNFKYHDYFSSINADLIEPQEINNKIPNEKEILDKATLRPIDLDLDKLISAFPMDYVLRNK